MTQGCGWVALDHGVSRLRTLLRIELPLVWPALVSVVIWIFTIAIAAFDVPAVIGMGPPWLTSPGLVGSRIA